MPRHHQRGTALSWRTFRLPVLAVTLAAGTAVGLRARSTPALTLIGVDAVAYPSVSPGVNTIPGPNAGTATARKVFTISGRVSGLYPGADLPLVLTITNPNASPITVTSITTNVEALSAGCDSTELTVPTFSGSLAVPAKHAASLTVLARMSAAAPNACQGAHFLFAYSGTGTTP